MPPKFQAPTDAELARRFAYHAPPPGSDVQARYGAVRNSLMESAKKCRDVTPVCPEQSRAINHLEEAMFLFNAAIARAEAADLPALS